MIRGIRKTWHRHVDLGSHKSVVWNVRGLSTRQSDLRSKILKLGPHVLAMQENRRWDTNDKDLKWKGATVFNGPPRQLTKGNMGGLAVVVNPKIHCKLIICKNPEKQRFDNPDETIDPKHLQQESWENGEELIPDEDMDLLLLELDSVRGGEEGSNSVPLSNITNNNRVSRRTRRNVRRRQSAQEEAGAAMRAGHQTNTKGKDQGELIQSLTMDLEGGYRIRGAYIGPQTKKDEVKQFITETIETNGEKHLLCGDLNARNVAWISQQRSEAPPSVRSPKIYYAHTSAPQTQIHITR